MARITFVTPYYPPEVGAAPTYVSETAESLVRQGHEVTVLTAYPSYPLGIIHEEYRHGKKRCEVRHGVTVRRIRHYVAPNRGFLRRTLSQLSFGIAAALWGAEAIGQPDVVIAISPPLFTTIGGRVLAQRKHCPFIFNASDIWPEAAIQLGVLRNRLAIRIAEAVEQWGYRGASVVWTVTEGFANTLINARGVPAEKVLMVPIGADTGLLRPLPKEQCRAELGWNDRFTLVHVGTIGLCQELSTLVEAADILRDDPDFHIVLVGDGATRQSLMAEVRQRGLTNITFTGLQPRGVIPTIVGAADVCYCALQQVPLFEGTMPMKAYEAMSCGRPLILAAEGDARRIAEQDAGAAVHVEPGNPQALAEAIRHLRAHPDICRQLGTRGRTYIEASFDRDALTARVEERIMEVLRQQQGTAERKPAYVDATQH